MGDGSSSRDGAKGRLVDAFSAFGGDALRDVWLFDKDSHERMYLRDDVERKVADVDVPRFVDNERYGYVTRDTYADLYYADYEYTVRGFDEFEQFRTFLSDDSAGIGVFASFDPVGDGYNYRRLHETIAGVVADHAIEDFVPK
ncbi:DUF7522 family protein [Halorussus litoreus]|uniref:DUF7522 family protein n=1 Tax=Halorussus litoreus TaxID=1710536 RepID=UPI000E2219D5|nr:hypothetical protein [Halorussus litoreus]